MAETENRVFVSFYRLQGIKRSVLVLYVNLLQGRCRITESPKIGEMFADFAIY